jgi:hypothetical protein
MAVAIASYSRHHFQELPTLDAARNRFVESNGGKLVMDVFKDFFVSKGMDRTFGLTMPHRHFDIPPGHIMVNYNGTSTAWPASPDKGMDKPRPAIWSFSSTGELRPTEFSYSKGQNGEMGEKERAFVADLKCLLDEKNLTEMFGLCEYPGDDFEGTCEITVGSVNINLKPRDVR